MKIKNRVRVVIDTNIWISFLIGKIISGLSDAIIEDKVLIIFSKELFDELTEVLQRPKFRKYFSQDNIKELIALLHAKTEIVEITEHFSDCRDPKDNFLLDLCVSANVDCLITGDEDLLELNPFHGIKIIDYRVFRETYNI